MAGCNKCGAKKSAGNGKRLSRCPGEGCKAKYCSEECQVADWREHRKVCHSFQSNPCWICKKPGKDEEPIYKSCQCRGNEGCGHLKCFIRYAKLIDDSVFQACPHCKAVYHDDIRAALDEEWSIVLAETEAKAASKGDTTKELFCKLERAKAMLRQDNEAEQVLEDCMLIYESYRSQHGEEKMFQHFDACAAALVIADAKEQLGRFDDGLEWLTSFECAFQSTHVNASWREGFQIQVDQRFVRLNTNLEQHEAVLSRAEKVFSYFDSNPDGDLEQRLFAGHDLFAIYMALQDYEKAAPLWNTLYKLSKRAMGHSHPVTLMLKQLKPQIDDSIAIDSNHDDQEELSFKNFDVMLTKFRMEYGKDEMLLHYRVVNFIIVIGGTFTRPEYAEFSLKWLKKLNRVMRSSDARVTWKADIQPRLDKAFGHIYVVLDRYEDARPFCERRFERARTMGNSQEEVKEAASQLLLIYDALGDCDATTRVEEDAQQILGHLQDEPRDTALAASKHYSNNDTLFDRDDEFVSLLSNMNVHQLGEELALREQEKALLEKELLVPTKDTHQHRGKKEKTHLEEEKAYENYLAIGLWVFMPLLVLLLCSSIFLVWAFFRFLWGWGLFG